jgi:hypothetical protein
MQLINQLLAQAGVGSALLFASLVAPQELLEQGDKRGSGLNLGEVKRVSGK